ncbi:MAG TPA: ATP-binding protein [Kiritimatiellia bacterium]|nr:ATP-binding protein [Kiritimatiellia bacterium]HMP00002.1 ATP-binding protein [Kiritimatiellia bacterium]HMP97393.1 ATP-binding protein [Kiritimatiellia bacterium]
MTGERTFLARFNEPDDAVESRMIEELDAVFGHPPRQKLPAGSILFHQNDPLDGILILMEGTVTLYQVIEGKEVVFHSQTVGKILGLLALTRHSRSFFNCRAVTPVTVMKIGFDELDRALQEHSNLLVSFITVLVRSMARRNKRLVELQTEILGLNRSLGQERDALSRTLKELQQAQALLVESEKMATLGQLAAGVAHELNNPVAAIGRAADFVREDLLALAGELPDGEVFREMLERTFRATPFSTREQREFRRLLAGELGDEALAERLVAIGIHQPATYHLLTENLSGTGEETLRRLERYHQLGGALRNILRCGERIAELVKSLRSYARADSTEGGEINVHEGLEDTLRLFSNRLRDVTVERHFGDLPPIQAHAGELNQVWTNLIANALDAMKNQGRLAITTTRLPEDRIAVRIIDSGPGIPPEHLDKIFNLRFTTRQGRVEFGLGLGLSISHNIIARHGGAIEVQSQPGRTEFCVKLPISREAAIIPATIPESAS